MLLAIAVTAAGSSLAASLYGQGKLSIDDARLPCRPARTGRRCNRDPEQMPRASLGLQRSSRNAGAVERGKRRTRRLD